MRIVLLTRSKGRLAMHDKDNKIAGQGLENLIHMP